MTQDEKKKITNKGRGWLSDYLKEIAEGNLSEKATKQLLVAVCSLYRHDMQTNEVFFNNVHDFCSKRRCKAEKAAFFESMLSHLVHEKNNNKDYVKRIPENNVRKNDEQ